MRGFSETLWARVLCGALAASACSDDDGGDDVGDGPATTDASTGSTGEPAPMNAQPTLEARVDAAAACAAGASALELRATKIGCVDPPPAPCTLPNPPRTDVGDPLACPSSE